MTDVRLIDLAAGDVIARGAHSVAVLTSGDGTVAGSRREPACEFSAVRIGALRFGPIEQREQFPGPGGREIPRTRSVRRVFADHQPAPLGRAAVSVLDHDPVPIESACDQRLRPGRLRQVERLAADAQLVAECTQEAPGERPDDLGVRSELDPGEPLCEVVQGARSLPRIVEVQERIESHDRPVPRRAACAVQGHDPRPIAEASEQARKRI